MDSVIFVRHILNIVFYFFNYYDTDGREVDSIFLLLVRCPSIDAIILVSLSVLECRKIHVKFFGVFLCSVLSIQSNNRLLCFCLCTVDSLSMRFLSLGSYSTKIHARTAFILRCWLFKMVDH